MRKFIFGLALALVSFVATAQESREIVFKSLTNKTSFDTVTNTATKIMAIPATPQYFTNGSVGITVTKISGTTGGVVRLMASYDGVNFTRINPTDSLVVGNVTTSTRLFTLANYPYKYLGLQYTGVGTMSARISGTALLKRSR